MCKIDSSWEAAEGAQLCDDLEGGMGVGRAPEGGGMCGHIADLLIVQQELTQHCKATTPSI